VVMRDETVMAFMDIRPVTRGHLLVMPTDHYEYLAELPVPVAERLFAAGRALAASLRASELAPAGVNLLYADGDAAGQEVPHSHLHVIPRYPSDGFTVDAEAWQRPPPARTELDATAALIAIS
jgi:histidine triad (HIT) family protein